MLFIDIYSALIEFSSRKLNENVTYRHYRYVWTVWTGTYLLPRVTKYFQGVEMGAKWGRNGAKMLIIDNFSTVVPYIRCKVNKNVTYRHYRCLDSVD